MLNTQSWQENTFFWRVILLLRRENVSAGSLLGYQGSLLGRYWVVTGLLGRYWVTGLLLGYWVTGLLCGVVTGLLGSCWLSMSDSLSRLYESLDMLWFFK